MGNSPGEPVSPKTRNAAAVLAVSLAVCGVSLAYFLSFRDCGFNVWDEGVPLSGALRLDNGMKPGIDFSAYAPGRYLLYLWSLKWSGGLITGPRTAMAAMGGIIAGLIYWTAVPLLGFKAALIPSGLYLVMPSPYYYRFFTLALLLSIAVLYRLTSRFNLRTGILLGLMGACAGWIREEVGGGLWIAMCLITLIRMRSSQTTRPLVHWTPAVLTTTGWLLKCLYWGGVGPTIKAYRIAAETMEESTRHMGLPWPEFWNPEYWRMSGFWYGFEDLHIWLAPVILAAALWMGIARFRHNRHFWILWSVSLFSMGLILFRPGFGNLQRILPPVVILTVAMLQNGTSRTAISIRLFKTAASVWAVLLVADSLLINPFSYDSIGMHRVSDAYLQNPKMPIRCRRDDASLFNTVDRSLHAVLKPGESLVCLPFHPVWNYSTGHLNPTYYEWLLPGMIPERRKPGLVTEFQDAGPDIILLDDIPLDGYDDRKFSRQYPELFACFERGYYRWMSMDYFLILVKIPGDALSLLDEQLPDRLERLEGQHELTSVREFGQNWPVLRQTGPALCDIRCAIPPGGVLKSGVVMRGEILDPGTVSVSFVPEDPGHPSIHRKYTSETVTEDAGVFLDLASCQGLNGVIRLESAAGVSAAIDWVRPVLFAFREIDPLVDNLPAKP